MEKSKYVIVDSYSENSSVLDWSFIPETFLELISKDLCNVPAISLTGDIKEKTVIFLKPVDKFSGNVNTIELEDIIIGKELNSAEE